MKLKSYKENMERYVCELRLEYLISTGSKCTKKGEKHSFDCVAQLDFCSTEDTLKLKGRWQTVDGCNF